MIEHASDILQQLVEAADAAFSEFVYPLAVGDKTLDDAQERTLNAALPAVPNRKDSPTAAVSAIIGQSVAVISMLQGKSPEDAFRRALEQVGLQLSQEVDRLTDTNRRLQYEDCSVFVEKDDFLAAAAVAAAHVVSSAARSFRVFDLDSLADFIAAELDEANHFMMADASSLKAAARACGMASDAN